MVSITELVDVLLVGQAHFLMDMCVSGWLGTGLGVDAYLITLILDKLMELGFSDRYSEGLMVVSVGLL